jgi:hypothetical protein
MEDRGDDLPQSNRHKRVKNLSSQLTMITTGIEQYDEWLNVKDEKACSIFYRRILADAHQGLCKRLAKWWIKAINPQKQTNNPYAGGSEKKPNWWPMTPSNNSLGTTTKGTLENGFVRHKEPDHLSKSGKNLLH